MYSLACWQAVAIFSSLLYSKKGFAPHATIVGPINPQGQCPSRLVPLRHGLHRVHEARIKDQQASVFGQNVHVFALGGRLLGQHVIARILVNTQGAAHGGRPIGVQVQDARGVSKIVAHGGSGRRGGGIGRPRQGVKGIVAMGDIKVALAVFGQLDRPGDRQRFLVGGGWQGIGIGRAQPRTAVRIQMRGNGHELQEMILHATGVGFGVIESLTRGWKPGDCCDRNANPQILPLYRRIGGFRHVCRLFVSFHDRQQAIRDEPGCLTGNCRPSF